MQTATKVIVAVIVVVLILVIGLIAAGRTKDETEPAVTGTPEAAMTQETTTQPEDGQEPEENPSTEPDGASQEAQDDDAQEVMYEGALAGMTEEEIAAQALAEEQGAQGELDD